MNLVKWLRKNNKKIMAVVVIVLMVGFIGGSALSYLLNPGSGDKAALGYYGSHKIRYYDREVARQELEIMQQLGIPQVLEQQDLGGLLMTELLFQGDRSIGDTATAAQRTVQQNMYRVSNRQLANFFSDRSSFSPEVLWILLREEAKGAGICIRRDEARQNLVSLLDNPQSGGPGYARNMQALITRYRMPEDAVLDIFGSLMSVFQYAAYVCTNENMTTAELRHLVSTEGEGLDSEFVQFKASDFVDKKMAPAESEMQAQLQKYKGTFAGDVSEANPFGFGYKLPDRIQAEYIVVKLDDVQTIIKKPTQAEVYEFYQQNRDTRYTREVRSDPNDSNSPMTKQVQSYSEVGDAILTQLTREKVALKAEQILVEAKDLADADLPAAASDGNEPNTPTLMAKAGKYDEIAKKLTDKHKIAVVSGRTGLITPTDVQNDRQLSRLRLASSASNVISVTQALFSVKELGDHAIILLSQPATKMYRTIGPLRDASMTGVMAVARVVSVEKAAEPADLNVAYSTKTLALGNTSDANGVHSVKDEVAKDLKLLAAWDGTKAKAQEFIELAAKDPNGNWDKAVARFNDLYGKELKKDPNDPNIFRVDRNNGVRRTSEAQMEVIRALVANGPNAQSVLARIQTERLLADRLYSLVPADANAAPKMPAVMEFKPDGSFYALKSVTVQRVNQQQFKEMKNSLAFRNEHIETQSLTAVHFDPHNIVKRMQFKYVEEGAAHRVVENPAAPEGEF